MAVKIFVLGRPGSGKTTGARYISEFADSEYLTTINIDDYTILQKLFIADKYHERFLPTPNNGFDVIDFSVLNEALLKIRTIVAALNGSHHIITIEFARDDYAKALDNFNAEFFRNTCFLYLNTNVETCLERIHARVAHPCSEGDHPSLSDKDFRKFYGEDNISDFVNNLHRYGISKQHLHIINNEGTKEMFKQEIQYYYRDIIKNTLYELVCALI